jgi:hypothetical protein
MPQDTENPALPEAPEAPPGWNGPAPTAMDWHALHKTAAFLEKARLADYVAMMNNPWKSAWLNLLAGIARGAGIVIGGSIIGAFILFGVVAGLKIALLHAGGVPWVGAEMKDAIGWVLEVIKAHGGTGK